MIAVELFLDEGNVLLLKHAENFQYLTKALVTITTEN